MWECIRAKRKELSLHSSVQCPSSPSLEDILKAEKVCIILATLNLIFPLMPRIRIRLWPSSISLHLQCVSHLPIRKNVIWIRWGEQFKWFCICHEIYPHLGWEIRLLFCNKNGKLVWENGRFSNVFIHDYNEIFHSDEEHIHKSPKTWKWHPQNTLLLVRKEVYCHLK